MGTPLTIATGTLNTGTGEFVIYPSSEWHFVVILLMIIASLLFVDLVRRIFAPHSR